MQYLIIIIATLVALFAPRRDFPLFITTLATVTNTEAPLFQNDESKVKTAAFMVAVGFRESTFDIHAVSKTGDYCWFQINGRKDLAEKPEECVRTAFTMMRESFRMCPDFPLAFYAEGPGGCKSERAQRISVDRLNLAKWALGQLKKD